MRSLRRPIGARDQLFVDVARHGALPSASAETNTAAIISAINESAELDGIVKFRGLTYNVNSGFVLPANVGIHADAKTLLRFGDTGTAFEVRNTIDFEMRGRELTFPAMKRGTSSVPLWYSGTDTTSIGIKIVGLVYAKLYIPAVMNFNTGVLFDAAAQNIVCNTVTLGRINNNRTGLHLAGTPTYGANQNIFTGGTIRIDSAYTAPGCTKILMTGVESNGNTFVGVNLEASASELAIKCDSVSNVWVNCRFEAGHTIPGFVTFTSTAHANLIFAGAGNHEIAGAWSTMVSDAGSGNTYQFANALSSKKLTIDFRSDAVIKIGNGTSAPAYVIGPYGTNRARFGFDGSPGYRHFGAAMQERVIQTSGSTLGVGQHFQLNYASPTTITNVNGSLNDRTIASVASLVDLNGNVTLLHTASPAEGAGRFVNKAGANKLLSANVPAIYVACNGNLYEV